MDVPFNSYLVHSPVVSTAADVFSLQLSNEFT